MLDISKIKVGDEIAVRMTVVETDESASPICAEFLSSNIGAWLRVSDIATHTPAPREIKVGDVVKWDCSGKLYQNAKVIAIYENSAWVLGDKRGEGLTTLLMEHLEHA